MIRIHRELDRGGLQSFMSKWKKEKNSQVAGHPSLKIKIMENIISAINQYIIKLQRSDKKFV